MKPVVTADGVVELGLAILNPDEARRLGHLLFQAADAAYLQDARNFAFRANQRTSND